MTPPEIYAITVASIVVASASTRYVRKFWYALQYVKSWFIKRLMFMIIPKTRWFGPCPWSTLLLQTLIISTNLLLILYPPADVRTAARRAGEIAVINMAILYLGPGLLHQAHWLNVTLSRMISIHGGITLPLVILTTFHAAALEPYPPLFRYPFSEQSYGVIAALALALLLLLCIRRFRRHRYQIFIRTHQLTAGVILFATWMHVQSGKSRIAKYCTIGMAACLGLGCIEQGLQILALNRIFCRGLPRAQIKRLGHMVRVEISTPNAVKINAGQYMNIYIPRVSLWQTRPFVVTSTGYSERGMLIELMAEPLGSGGWTSNLHDRAPEDGSVVENTDRSYYCFFSKPQGFVVDANNYGLVIMVASGCGIIAQVPYLQHLIRGYHNGTTKSRRIRLIWQLRHVDMGRAYRHLINQALREDYESNSYSLEISIYFHSGKLSGKEQYPGQRAHFIPGKAKWSDLIHGELESTPVVKAGHEGQQKQLKKKESQDVTEAGDEQLIFPNTAFQTESRRAIVLVAAGPTVRQKVREACRTRLSPKLRWVELDYQPKRETEQAYAVE